ncbi:MAG: DUF4832 domain-containing protein [Bacteroidales bacterium]|nr:DUF4832 domain-containing protein [Bacteroidales bacterium]
MRRISIISASALCLLALSCTPKDPFDAAGLQKVSYEATDEIFPNPERGFYSGVEVMSASSRPVSNTAIEAGRKSARTLLLLEFHIGDYVESDIAEEYLQLIRTDFQALRDCGAKCVLRFAYSNGMDEKDKPWDASVDQVMRHVAQLKPILQEYYDVIFVLQAGFIGSWGEWYYTDHFNASSDRKKLVDALLDALPAERQVELRTPAYKKKLYEWGLADTITRATAHQPTTKARLGGHNDCYLASSNDTGTYSGKLDRTYWEAESAYTIMGGETCGLSAFCHCEQQPDNAAARGVISDMAANHFTYLNNGYHTAVLARWRSEGCMEEIQRRLGYRLALTDSYFSKSPAAGADMRVVLNIENQGFASPMNPRDAFLVLTDAAGKVLQTWPVESDPRFWMPGQTTTLDQTVKLPSGISGNCTLWLHLPDPCSKLKDNSRFAIRLANAGVWDDSTGYNKLHTFTL